jgi:hypothetical protein
MRRLLVGMHDATPPYARATRMMIRDLAPLLWGPLCLAAHPDDGRLVWMVPEQLAETLERLGKVAVRGESGVTSTFA